MFVFCVCLSDGLVVVGVHSAKFPNEKVRPVRFVCAFFLYFCNWKVSINSCHFGNALKFKTIGNKETFSKAIKRIIAGITSTKMCDI